MTAGIYNFTIEQGTYFKRVFTWRETDPDGTPGDPIDITGYTPHMQIRTPRGELILDCDEYLTLNGPAGEVTLVIGDNVMDDKDFDTAVYDLFLDGPQSRKLIKGLVTFEPATTRDD